MNQTIFADIAGVSRKTLSGYESGERFPDADALAKWADEGLDVQFVVTGIRTIPVPLPSLDEDFLEPDLSASAGGSSSAISASDRVLLRDFHAAPAQVQAGVKTALGAFAPSVGSPGKWKRTA